MSRDGAALDQNTRPASVLRVSVVIPAFNRRDTVVANVSAFARQQFDGGFEVVVVDDGSSDGTAAALRGLELGFPLRVVEQANLGAAAARNRGAREARGELLLFLDDDMEPDPGLLAAHDRRHREGADAVVGHMPVHPSSPPGFLARGSQVWVDWRKQTLTGVTTPLPGSNFLTGQASVSRRLFERLGGFDEGFNRSGSYGREDTDFGVRLERAGGRIVYEPTAVTHQHYLVTPRRYLARQKQLGRANVALLRKLPNLPEFVVKTKWLQSRRDRWVGSWLARLLEPPLLALLESGFEHRRLERLFFWISRHRYWRGAYEAGGYPERGALRVLAYHSVSDLAGAPVIARFGTPPAALRRQLAMLRRLGFRFVTPAELIAYLHDGGGLPRRALLVTFDDAFADLAEQALPVLRELAVPALTFVVSGQVGGHNEWDTARGAPRLPLCDREQLAALAVHGVAIGSHGRTHRRFDRQSDADLAAELTGSADDLEALGGERPRLVAYPYGFHDERVRQAARAAGYAAAFTARAGLVTPQSDPWALPRIEILRRDTGLRFLLKVISGGRGWRGLWSGVRH